LEIQVLKPKVFIATPVGSSHVHSRYCTSLFRLGRHLQENGVESAYWTIQASDIAFQRDLLADIFLKTQDCTHLLFVDSDMEFEPNLALKLLSFKKDFIGTIYSSRKIDLKKLAQSSASGAPFNDAAARAHEFQFSGKIEIQGDLCTTDFVGMGFTLIGRDCFKQIGMHCQLTRYPAYDRPNEIITGFFRHFTEPNGAMVSEDISFCRRARESGVTIFAYPKAKVGHVGEFVYGTPFTDFIKTHDDHGNP
jgi:hypothetical protein